MNIKEFNVTGKPFKTTLMFELYEGSEYDKKAHRILKKDGDLFAEGKFSNEVFQYNITNKMSLRKYMASGFNQKKVYYLIDRLIDAQLCCEESGVDPKYMMYDADLVLVDKDTEEISFIYVPATDHGLTYRPMKAFIKEILANAVYDEMENLDYVGRLLTYVNKNKVLDAAAFSEALSEVKRNQKNLNKITEQGAAAMAAAISASAAGETEEDAVSEDIVSEDAKTETEDVLNAEDIHVEDVLDEEEKFQMEGMVGEDEIHVEDVLDEEDELHIEDMLGKEEAAVAVAAVVAEDALEAEENVSDAVLDDDASDDEDISISGIEEFELQTKTEDEAEEIHGISFDDPLLEEEAEDVETVLTEEVVEEVSAEAVAEETETEAVAENVETEAVAEEPETEAVAEEQAAGAVVGEPEEETPKCPYLVREKNHEKITINKDEFKLGKISGADYMLSDNPAVSRMHAIIHNIDNTYYICDNYSTNATYLNGERLEPGKNYLLMNGVKVRLANDEFTYVCEE